MVFILWEDCLESFVFGLILFKVGLCRAQNVPNELTQRHSRQRNTYSNVTSVIVMSQTKKSIPCIVCTDLIF